LNNEPNILDSDSGISEFSITTFESKVTIVAEEVLKILKDLSKSNLQNISSKLIAERMIKKDLVKHVFEDLGDEELTTDNSGNLNELMDGVLKKFSELLPSSLSEDFAVLKEQIKGESNISDFVNWLGSAVQIIKKYVNTATVRNGKLEKFLLETVKLLMEIDHQIANELNSQQKNLKEEIDYKASLSYDMHMIKQCFNMSSDIEYIKKAVFSKIENIKEGLDEKRKQDLLHLEETEGSLNKIRAGMKGIQQEADKAKEKFQELEFNSMHDTLTGLYNRKIYNERIEETLAEFERYKTPFTLMVLDIDHFKKVNDTFGHKAGDLVLKKVASLIKENVRKNDFIARYGGDEFVIILSHTHSKEALTIGEHLRTKISEAKFLYNKEKEIRLTVSGGISIFKDGDNAGTVFERADKALYIAKQSGRNTIKSDEKS
jgi:diguanylate cyclase